MQTQTTFATKAEATAAGWVSAAGLGRDVSGPNSYGYVFELDGIRSTTIWLTDERNQMGQKGCFVEMFQR